jgi:hypothetical protein
MIKKILSTQMLRAASTTLTMYYQKRFRFAPILKNSKLFSKTNKFYKCPPTFNLNNINKTRLKFYSSLAPALASRHLMTSLRRSNIKSVTPILEKLSVISSIFHSPFQEPGNSRLSKSSWDAAW